ncbi:MAG TPA: hypothetical protein VFI65_23665 [Streptosporangiaceae bacterium]|nr:hypothetical protein [Streptosporangiaceae bacterium]
MRVAGTLALAGVAVVATAAAGPAHQRSAPGFPAWLSTSGALAGVTEVGPSNAWAVGYTSTTTLIMAFNGHSWRVESRRPGAYARLLSVSASSAHGAWAVGSGRFGTAPLAERLTGSGWKQVPAPNPRGGTTIAAVAAITVRNVWAVGGNSRWTVILHWNGRSWQRVRSPSPSSSGSYLQAVAAKSPTNAWAVGTTSNRTLIEHWTGQGWHRTASPSPGGSPVLNGVAASSAANAWAVGGLSNSGKTLILHWNGRSWRRVPSPSPRGFSVLSSVTVTSFTSAWAVGYAGGKTLILHWDGRSWRRVPSPSPASYCTLLSVSAASPTNAWAVGSAGSKTLILHWNGRNWQ